MKVKIIAEMTETEKQKYLKDWGDGFTIENIVFELVGPYDDYQDIEVRIVKG